MSVFILGYASDSWWIYPMGRKLHCSVCALYVKWCDILQHCSILPSVEAKFVLFRLCTITSRHDLSAVMFWFNSKKFDMTINHLSKHHPHLPHPLIFNKFSKSHLSFQHFNTLWNQCSHATQQSLAARVVNKINCSPQRPSKLLSVGIKDGYVTVIWCEKPPKEGGKTKRIFAGFPSFHHLTYKSLAAINPV